LMPAAGELSQAKERGAFSSGRD